MSFFEKLKKGLSKTKASFDEKINNVFKHFRKVDEELLEELEEALILSDVGFETTNKIIEQLRDKIKTNKIEDADLVKDALCEIISGILNENDSSLKLETNPSVILVVGVNGAGKTTSIGKLAANFKADGKKVLVAAADTFRAAAIEQLEEWTNRAGVDILKRPEGADPASVAFDASRKAKVEGYDIVIIDTAGRLHTKKNLMDELGKIQRTIRKELPDASQEVLIVLDGTSGQNAVIQAKEFSEVTEMTGIILTKLDGTAKGGVVISICSELNIPVKFIGVGEKIEDLQVFNSADFAKALLETTEDDEEKEEIEE
ncbi:MAG: signal recognition particle-docking protein FtsY [Clostridia bacterium]|nr:signal recognition particle-docking protein FtsY [Clostridia bacterium]